MNIPLFLALFSGLTLFYFLLGTIASKNIHSTTDYFLAGRNLGFFMVTFTLIATQLGGGMLLGTSQDAYKMGLFGILYTVGITLGFLALSCGLASRLQSLNVETTAQLFETRYNSIALRKIASLLSILTLCGLLIGQVVASRTVMSGLEISNEYFFLGFWFFIIAYTMIGGLKAVVVTDLFQVLFIILIFGGIFIYALIRDPNSLFSLIPSTQQHNFALQTITASSMLVTILMPALFSLIEQDLAQRFFAARSKKIAALSALSASIFMIIFALIPIYFGIQARMLNLPLADGASPLIPLLTFLTNEFVVALALCAIIAAITSTADSLLCAVSSNIAQDFDFSFIGIHNKLHLSRILTLSTGLVALIGSYFVPQNVICVLIGSYEISVVCLLIPLVISYFKPDLNKNAAFGAVFCGFAGFIVFRIAPLAYLPKECAALMLSALGYFCGTLVRSN